MRFYVGPKLRSFKGVKRLMIFLQQGLMCKEVELIIAVEVKGRIISMCITREPHVVLEFCKEVLKSKRLLVKAPKE